MTPKRPNVKPMVTRDRSRCRWCLVYFSALSRINRSLKSSRDSKDASVSLVLVVELAKDDAERRLLVDAHGDGGDGGADHGKHGDDRGIFFLERG